MKAKYQFQCLSTGIRHSVTFQDKEKLTIEDQVSNYLSSKCEIVDYHYF